MQPYNRLKKDLFDNSVFPLPWKALNLQVTALLRDFVGEIWKPVSSEKVDRKESRFLPVQQTTEYRYLFQVYSFSFHL